MKFTKWILPALGTLFFSGLAHADQMTCESTRVLQRCETDQFVFDITSKWSVVVTEKAVPGATGDVRELPYVQQKRMEFPFGEDAYEAGSYHVEVGHTDGTQIYLRIGSKVWNFFHEVGTP